jgi:hypothetical protein
MRTRQAHLWILLATLALGCRAATQVPEPGAVLLRLTVAPGAPSPDELRIFVYDDSGALWSDVRVPEQGALVPASADRLGTILIQPGASVGALRVEVRGLAAGARVLEGDLVIPPEARARGTFDLRLDPAMLPDGDGDGVPDDLDDCPAAANPAQGGCADGGTRDAPVESVDDGSVDDSGDQDAADDGGMSCGAPSSCDKPLGAACSSGVSCASGLCVDGVCCGSACMGLCRACNQTDAPGICKGHAAGTNPDLECASGSTCNGSGACGAAAAPGKKVKGELCGGATECGTGFCKEGVCCNVACTNPCQTCVTGTCQTVKGTTDAPECVAPMTCNNRGGCVAM